MQSDLENCKRELLERAELESRIAAVRALSQAATEAVADGREQLRAAQSLIAQLEKLSNS
jgi:hypothetical protein